jgi:hypothetical protein
VQPLERALAAIRERLASAKSDTENQRTWRAVLANTEKLIVEAIELRQASAEAPEDEVARRHASVRLGQVKLAIQKIRKGEASYKRNGDAAHGDTPKERQDGWREAKRQRVREKDGREPRHNRRRSDMTPEEWAAHKREQGRLAKAKLREKKRAKLKS